MGQRRNVYSTIRGQVAFEHKRIDHRMFQIHRQKWAEKKAKDERAKQHKEQVARAKLERARKQQEEMKKAQENKQALEKQQEKEKEKQATKQKMKQTWTSIMSGLKGPAAEKQGQSQTAHKISELQNKQNALRSVIKK